MIDDTRLDEVLASIGPLLVLDPAVLRSPVASPPVTADDVGRPMARRPRQRRRRWVLAAAALTAVVGVSVSPLRGVVADWLGIGSTQVEVRPDMHAVPTDLPGIDAGATPISPRQAETVFGAALFDRLGDTELGSPFGFATISEGGVIAVWPDSTTLWVHGEQMPVAGWLQKMVSNEQQVQRVDDLGDDALAVVGDHILETPNRTIRAPTTVLWTRDRQELRLAGDHPVDTLIAIARALDGS